MSRPFLNLRSPRKHNSVLCGNWNRESNYETLGAVLHPEPNRLAGREADPSALAPIVFTNGCVLHSHLAPAGVWAALGV
jgi:hypothetical protein